MQHSDVALAVARETGWDVDAEAVDREWSGVGVGPVGQHRDSPALDRSNFDVVLADLTAKFPDSVADVRFGHWGVGWVEEVIFDAGHAEAVAAVQEWRDALENYPVADEEAFCALEYEEALETITAILPSSIGELELREDLPEDYVSVIFSEMFNSGCDTSPDGMRGAAVEEAALELGFYA